MEEKIIVCTKIHTKEDLHRIFREVLSFPACYGNNLDALHDCLTSISEKTHLILQNWASAASFAKGFKFVFDDAETENPNLFITIQ